MEWKWCVLSHITYNEGTSCMREERETLFCFLLVSTFYLDCYEFDQGQGSLYHFWASVPVGSYQNIHMERNISQNFYLGFIFLFYLKKKEKKGVTFCHFLKLNFPDFTNQKVRHKSETPILNQVERF